MKKTFLAFLFILGLLLVAGCSSNRTSNIPSDFLFIMDVKSADDSNNCINVNIRIDATGKGRYEIYDTDCAITFDTNHMVTYERSQVIETGKITLSDAELEQLWNAITQNNFFNLTDDYRMSIGFSYAFIVVEADGQRHVVDNIGMEVPEIKAIVETMDALMPEGVNLDYREGFLF